MMHMKVYAAVGNVALQIMMLQVIRDDKILCLEALLFALNCWNYWYSEACV